ncbi:uncharacterized protein AMSG_03674 [Thecamonas trahens ATCC 50062]|uniref:Uncharacterized protein n=1 Tax=Thecamonas trahens ATCC 50062 TaxID=461836 RepID=A0A0L0D4S1_THETB|nr:hypothetical protein AMSG_03674 [Thecamonas trahens ATCC 50062]KNC47245.1 hypothetical protein AMSG_03674 [Thecamonas trahens ATCC 50062]|eukprot:XP_013759588.1 hypothetical protein AMSG_03674 [Thecamonas trahens ATCC 50062]
MSTSSGKSSLISELAAHNWQTLDEGFMEAPTSKALSPQSLTMELAWVSAWFDRLLGMMEESPSEAVFFADRSPFSAVFYAANGELLEPVIQAAIEELRSCDIHIMTVHIETEPETLWARINARLEIEPERKLYREDDRSWMDTTVAFYESRKWDLCLDNTNTSVSDLRLALLDAIKTAVPDFEPATSKALTPKASDIAEARLMATSPVKSN